MGSIAHALHATRDEYLLVACTDSLRGKHDSFETGAADFVDGKRRDIDREASANGSLTSGGLTNPSGDNIAHDYFVDGVWRYC
jgi:hypothetical protein